MVLREEKFFGTPSTCPELSDLLLNNIILTKALQCNYFSQVIVEETEREDK